ncbi:ABC transporter ATP-binding protein [Aminithiophilus ramosus]|uniref:ABC transporter ATP-binding protein n=2 Tax=Synergistales TaxID=649776 RepID=A0A9Q7AJ35_9BACT|nr:ABC transporter ATP-binding protein [Aminithiophilus ramosus]QTX32630.1 ABC transporter ATP-binding protein [Aminithiophilus ramosus]QVL36506.1 ABC transporter ATP-binding protein [Synergistota bacterium]
MDNLLEIKGLRVAFHTDDGTVHALNDVDLELGDGETLGLVGETGAGKTTLARSIMRLIPSPPGVIEAGEIFFEGRDLVGADISEMLGIRGNRISMIFQDPMSALNPVITIGDQIAEVIGVHQKVSHKEAWERALLMLGTVGISADRAGDYPHQFSGGMKQRVVIAIALACNPTLLIADEPTTALDVTIQAQVLEMMADLKKKLGTATILITHDLGIVAQMCENVAILYAGEIVEAGTVHDIFKRTLHPYTEGLLAAIPKINENVTRLRPIDGLMPDPMALPEGCAFRERCTYATDLCRTARPALSVTEGRHKVRCFHPILKGGASYGQ